MFSSQLKSLRSLVDQTASELSHTRTPTPLRHPLPPATHTTTLSTGVTSYSSSSFPHPHPQHTYNSEAIHELRREFEKRSQTTRDLVSYVDSDIKAGRILTEDTADKVARVTSSLEQLSNRLRTVEARQQELWNTVQQRPTRSEMNSTIAATLLPATSYAKTRLDSLAASVAALEAAWDIHAEKLQQGGDTTSTPAHSTTDRTSTTSLSYLEERLERRMEDFIERKMRIREVKLEANVVHAVKKSLLNRKKQEAHEAQAHHPNENEGGTAGNASAESTTTTTTPSPPVESATVKDLEAVTEKMNMSLKLVQNSLVSLRTQLRMLGREVKVIKNK